MFLLDSFQACQGWLNKASVQLFLILRRRLGDGKVGLGRHLCRCLVLKGALVDNGLDAAFVAYSRSPSDGALFVLFCTRFATQQRLFSTRRCIQTVMDGQCTSFKLGHAIDSRRFSN